MTTCALKLGTIKLMQIFPGDLNQRVESCSLKPLNYLKVFTVCEGDLPVLGLRMWVGKSKVKLRVLWLTEVCSHAPINSDHSSPHILESSDSGLKKERGLSLTFSVNTDTQREQTRDQISPSWLWHLLSKDHDPLLCCYSAFAAAPSLQQKSKVELWLPNVSTWSQRACAQG